VKKKGLTLVELLVVVSILAILAGIIYTVVGNIQWRVKFTRCMTHLKECGIVLRMYAQDWNGFVPPFVSIHLSIDENLLKYFFPKANDPNLLANAFLNYSKSKEI
jgi:prepilin-type N-terminal cleavage/methylation domain-containing protein